MSTLLTEVGLFSYDSYLRKFENWVKEAGSSSSQPTAELIEFTRLNWARTQRIHHTVVLQESLKKEVMKLDHSYSWIVLTEAWCGDSAQNLPVIAEIAALNPEKIKLYLLLRDQNPEFMDNYLTNGSRAIPKLVCIDETLNKEAFVWGPRPAAAQGGTRDQPHLGLLPAAERAHGICVENDGSVGHASGVRHSWQTGHLRAARLAIHPAVLGSLLRRHIRETSDSAGVGRECEAHV